MSLLRQAEQCLLNQKTHSNLNAFISPFFRQSTQRWIDRLHEAEARKEHGTQLSAIDGQLIAVKDNICTTDFLTTCASGILRRFTSPFNATVVELLEDAGAIVAGKTNLDEFGMGSHSTHSYFGPVTNQLGMPTAQYSAGGSSGGSAVAVMTGQCIAALGTDTGGSVRLPAAYTGILGFKPSYGLISRWGVIAYANSLDTVGILGGTCETVRNTFGILNQYDARDPTSLPSQSRSRILELISNHRREGPLRIGVPIEYNIQELSPTVKQAWESTIKTLKSQGHSIHPVSLPATRQALSAYYVLAPAEASSNLAKYDGIRYGTRAKAPTDSEAGYLYAQTRGEGFGDEVRRRILLGAFSLSAEAMDNYFIQAQKVRRLVQADFDGAFRLPNPLQTERKGDETGVDVLICPTVPSVPPTLESLRDSSPIDAYMNDVFTVPASLAGLPAMSVPVAVESEAQRVDGVNTVGIQVIGQYGDDDLVLRIGEVIEENNART